MTRVTFLLLLGASSALAQRESDLGLELHLESDHSRVGQAVRARFVYVNEGTETFYVQHAKSWTRHGLALEATLPGCRFYMEPMIRDWSTAAHRFRYVPLFVEDRLETHGPSAGGDGSGGVGLALPFPGTYRVRATFESEGHFVEGGIWPIWRGRIESTDVELALDPPGTEELAARLAALRECLGDLRGCLERDFYTVLDSFYWMHVPSSAAMLLEVLERSLESDEFVVLRDLAAHGLAAQGDAASGTVFHSLRERYAGDAEIQRLLQRSEELYYNRAACRESLNENGESLRARDEVN